jgi:excisionase family DNA binding protein
MANEIVTPRDLRTREEAAVFLGVSSQTVTNLHRSGELPGVYIGKFLRFSQKSISDYASRCVSKSNSKNHY